MPAINPASPDHLNTQESSAATVVGAVEEIAIGSAQTVTVGTETVAVFRTDTGFYALTDRCSHASVALSDGYLEGDVIECPAHFGQFCVKNGKALALPAVEPVVSWPVQVIDGQVYVMNPTEEEAS